MRESGTQNPVLVQPGIRRESLFGLGFVVAASGAVALALMSVDSESAPGQNTTTFTILLALTSLIVLMLAGLIGVRVLKRLLGRRFDEPAPKLLTRFITLFAIAAVIPAILLAGFQTLILGRGIEFWFGEHVNSVVEASADLAREWPQVAMRTASIQIIGGTEDLSQPGALDALVTNPVQYRQYLSQQARLRSFPALYIIDDKADILARADITAQAPDFLAPSQTMYDIANEGDIGTSNPQVRDDAPDYVRMLVALPEVDNIYLYAVWYVDFSLLSAQEEMTLSFREAGEREAQMRRRFFLVFALATTLIFIGAVWLAVSAAESIVRPVSRLVSAAEKVRLGNLSAHVDVPDDDDEIAVLGRAFNRMTRQLSTQRQDLIETNEQSEKRRFFIEAVLTGVSAGVIGIDRSGIITLANRSAANLLDCEPEDINQCPLQDVAGFLVPIAEETHRFPDKIAEHQVDILATDGAQLHLNVRAAQDEEGGVVVTFDDVTRLVAAQRNAAWRDVARRIAHEIKNPLTPIQLSAERLRRKYRDQIDGDGLNTFDKCIETITRQVSDIGRMVDEFSSFARMPTPKMEQVDLVGIVNAAVFAQRVSSPSIEIPFSPPQMEIPVECDSRLASQALANILKNSAESVSALMESEGAKLNGEIKVSVSISEGFGIISVADNGLGWPMPDKARLTEPYMTTREKGTGLGLAIVRRVMEDHGGRLELDDPDTSKRGAVVRLAFPLLEADKDANSALNRAEA